MDSYILTVSFPLNKARLFDDVKDAEKAVGSDALWTSIQYGMRLMAWAFADEVQAVEASARLPSSYKHHIRRSKP